MEGPEGIDLATAIGASGRGFLWRASRQKEHDRIVQLVDPRFCDERFKNALKNLRQRQYPRMLKIAGEGWSGAHYYIEYEIDPPWQTLEERLAECANWRDRLSLLGPVCDALGLWEHGPVFPLGLNPRTIVLTDLAGRRVPWLVPCPAITLSSPCDLFGIDSTAMAALAPETIRGLVRQERAQDMYALGTLAAQAVGWAESSYARDDESRIESQARGALLVPAAAGSAIDPLVRTTPQVERLLLTIRRYRHTAPEARPHDAVELRTAVAEATDAIALAETVRPADPRMAMQILSSLDGGDPEQYLRGICLAAEIHRDIGDWRTSLRLLDTSVLVDPRRVELRIRRCEAWWEVLRTSRGELSQEQAQVLLKDLKLLKQLTPEDTMPYLCGAEIHRRLGDPESAAKELYAAAELDQSDVYPLYLYAQCWKKDLKDNTNVAAVATVARQRIAQLVKAGLMTPTEGQLWNRRFDDLLG